jgi:ABC-type ATPase with predicted acetyltransferase domain
MEKYGYEKDDKEPKTKIASNKTKCPKCGASIRGNPPVCPNHGSEPFEKKR